MDNSSHAEIEILLKKQTFQMWQRYSKGQLPVGLPALQGVVETNDRCITERKQSCVVEIISQGSIIYKEIDTKTRQVDIDITKSLETHIICYTPCRFRDFP